MSIHLPHKLNFEWVCVGSFSHYLKGSLHSKWLFGISSINSIPDWNEQSIINTWLMHEASVEFSLLNYQSLHQVRSNIPCPSIYIQYLDLLLKHHCTFTFLFGWMSKNLKKTKQTSSLYMSLQHLQTLKCAWPCNSIPLYVSKVHLVTLVNPRYRAKLKCAWLGWTNNYRQVHPMASWQQNSQLFHWKKNTNLSNLHRESFSVCSYVFFFCRNFETRFVWIYFGPNKWENVMLC